MDTQTQHTRQMVPASGARYPALLAAVFLGLGILVAEWVDWTTGVWTMLTILTLLLALLILTSRLRNRHASVVLTTSLLLVGLGALRMSAFNSNRPDPTAWDLAQGGETHTIVGRLTSIPIERSTGWRARFDIEAVVKGDSTAPVHTTALISTLRSLAELRYGDYVTIPARLRIPPTRRNPGGFDFANHLQRQGIDFLLYPSNAAWKVVERGSRWSPQNLVEPARIWIRETAQRIFTPISASLILGFLLGDTEGIPHDVLDAFRDSGTFHLLAVSGANVWLVLALALLPLRLLRVHRTVRTALLLCVIAGFCFLTRNEPSVLRASVMAGAMLVGRLMFRPANTLNAVGLAALIILLVSPAELYRAGFQLSFAAVIAIVILHSRLREARLLPRNWLLRWTVSLLAATVAASVATAPIIAHHFGTVPLLSMPANLLVVPLAGLASYAALIAFAMAAISPTLAMPAVAIVELVLAVAQLAVRLFSGLGGTLDWSQPSPLAILAVYLLAGLVLWWRGRYRWVRPLVYTAATLAVFGAIRNLNAHEPSPTVAFLDAGRTRVAVVIAPDDHVTWIVDDPGLSDDHRQWMTEPFLRAVDINPEHQSEIAWRRSDSTVVDWTSSTAGETFWQIITSPSDSLSAALVWADLFTFGQETVLHVRDFPITQKHGADRLIESYLPSATVLVLPARASIAQLRGAMLLATRAREVLFYGQAGWIEDENRWLETWRAHYPMIRFYFTPIHGGVRLAWNESIPTLTPFLAPFVWRDADYR